MLRIDVNSALAGAKLKLLWRNMTDLKPVEEPMIKAIMAANRRTFTTKGANIGKPWKPLSKSTLRRRRYRRLGTRPLRYNSARGGRAYRSLTVRGHHLSIAKTEGHHIVVGSKSLVAATATKGTVLKPKHGKPAAIKVPKRPVTGVDPKLEQDVAKILAKHLAKAAKQKR